MVRISIDTSSLWRFIISHSNHHIIYSNFIFPKKKDLKAMHHRASGSFSPFLPEKCMANSLADFALRLVGSSASIPPQGSRQGTHSSQVSARAVWVNRITQAATLQSQRAKWSAFLAGSCGDLLLKEEG